MGWFIERAKEKQRGLTSAGAIASRAWKPELSNEGLGSSEALGNRLRDLDKGKGLAWWLGSRGKPYLSAVAKALKVEPTELVRWIEAARPAAIVADDARWFRFEVFPALRPLDLDTEVPFPGVPKELFSGDGPMSLTWWYSPPGAGRTLLGQWLVRRHRWAIVSSDAAAERTFIEQGSADVPEIGVARRVVVASPHPMPSECHGKGWTQVVTPSGWEVDLVKWVKARLQTGGLYDSAAIEALVQAGRLTAGTPGQLIEILADVYTLGVGALTDKISPDIALKAWVKANANRADQTARPASLQYLSAHGVEVLWRAELTRLSQSLTVTRETITDCIHAPPPASADAIRAAHDARDVEGALQLICPQPADLVDAMFKLRWLTYNGWGFPTRVAGWLRQCVVTALVEGDDLRSLGTVTDAPDMLHPVLFALATSKRLAGWIGHIQALTELDPESAMGVDAVVLAMILAEARGEAVPEHAVRSLRESICRLASEEGVAVHLRVDRGWSALAWLSLFPPGQPPTDLHRRRVTAVSYFLLSDKDEHREIKLLRLLAATQIGELGKKDQVSYNFFLPSSAVAALAANKEPELQAKNILQGIRQLDIIERLCRPWTTDIGEIARLLHPLWEHRCIPEDEDLGKLSRIWAVYPSEWLTYAGPDNQIIQHLRRGMKLPDHVWHAIIELKPADQDVLALAPIDVLFALEDKFQYQIPKILWQRASERSIAFVAELLQNGADVRYWLRVAPPECNEKILSIVSSIATPSLWVFDWSERVISERASAWHSVWKWQLQQRR